MWIFEDFNRSLLATIAMGFTIIAIGLGIAIWVAVGVIRFFRKQS